MFVEIRDVLGVDMYSIYDCSCGDNNSSTDVSKKQNSFVEIRIICNMVYFNKDVYLSVFLIRG